MMDEFYIKQVTWATHEAQLRLIREQVFIREQQVPVALEWDAHDAGAWHLLAFNQSEMAIGCTRILHSGSIGRMAVLQEKRNLGVGKALLRAAIKLCQKNKLKEVRLSAQTHATAFYEKLDFAIVSDVYLDANILHVDMLLKLRS